MLLNYVGVKMIQAIKMSSDEFKREKGKHIDSESIDEPGYKVIYDGGKYESWSPKDVFEAAYFPITDSTRVVEDDVEAFIKSTELKKVDEKTTLVTCKTLTGFVQHEASSCVDPKNYNEELGKKYGKERIKSRLWYAMGFVLQWARFGLKGGEDDTGGS